MKSKTNLLHLHKHGTTFVYILPDSWCPALMGLGGLVPEKIAAAVRRWRMRTGHNCAFYASERRLDIPEVGDEGDFVTMECRSYSFSK